MRTTTRVPDPPVIPYKTKYNQEDLEIAIRKINEYLTDLHRFLSTELDR